ncbi:hypothetical protein H6800_02025 [Candidatus Nomurabacteria bacterium]|nr:hypothetical protein [Candidatus Nomurabacteria bacterium]
MKIRGDKLYLLRRATVSILIVSLFVVLGSHVFGQSGSNQLGQGLEISPPLLKVDADPGQTVTATIKLRNITDSTLIASANINDFIAQGEEGLPKLLLDETADTSSYGIKTWVNNIEDLTIAPKEQQVVEVVMNVPANASPGGHYGVIRFSAAAPEVKDTGVSLSASIGSLVLVKVSGDIQESATVEQFGVSKNDKSGSFFESGPLTIFERIKNTGNVHFQPTGTVTVKNFRGTEIAKLKVNQNGGNVLPDSVRKFEQELNKSNLFGRYTATMDISYGNNQRLTKDTSFWVIPYRLIAMIIGAVVLAVILIKRYNKHIIKKANNKRG